MQAEPPPLRSEDTSAVDLARKRLIKNKHPTPNLSLPRIPNLSSWWPGRRSRILSDQPTLPDDATLTEIDLNDAVDDLNIHQDIYRWAVVYENQRGLTIFSTPYYSRLGLLPHDPPSFTIPEADGKRNKQPHVSLHDYPLPDGNWQWVSRAWMVDMRREGQVHYDGFEYNWYFRRHKWCPEPGTLSARGLVRRRRWLRLMMRPAHPSEQSDYGNGRSPAITSLSTRYSVAPDDGVLELEAAKATVWSGDPKDWIRIHQFMVRWNRDGTRLELWREWLGVPPQTRHRKVWSEDEYSPTCEREATTNALTLEGTQRDNLAAVVRDHIEELIQLFVYPESRVEFLKMLNSAGIPVGLSQSDEPIVEFWSYRRVSGTSITC